jgi:hypothetical protein
MEKDLLGDEGNKDRINVSIDLSSSIAQFISPTII